MNEGDDRAIRPFIGLGLTAGGATLARAYVDGQQVDAVTAGGRLMLYGGAEWRLSERAGVQATYGATTRQTGVRWLVPVCVLPAIH